LKKSGENEEKKILGCRDDLRRGGKKKVKRYGLSISIGQERGRRLKGVRKRRIERGG